LRQPVSLAAAPLEERRSSLLLTAWTSPPDRSLSTRSCRFCPPFGFPLQASLPSFLNVFLRRASNPNCQRTWCLQGGSLPSAPVLALPASPLLPPSCTAMDYIHGLCSRNHEGKTRCRRRFWLPAWLSPHPRRACRPLTLAARQGNAWLRSGRLIVPVARASAASRLQKLALSAVSSFSSRFSSGGEPRRFLTAFC